MNKMTVASSILAIAALVLTTQMANTAFAARSSGRSNCQGGPVRGGCTGSGGSGGGVGGKDGGTGALPSRKDL